VVFIRDFHHWGHSRRHNKKEAMSGQPTPRTDAAKYDSQPGNPMFPNGKWVVPVEVSAQLESELAEARETIATMEIRHAAVMLHTQTIVDEANAIKQQRDRLAEALRGLMYGHNVGPDWEECVAALAAVEGGKP
jgi:hypothetical protein